MKKMKKARTMNKKVDKLGKMIDDWNKYLDKLKQEEIALALNKYNDEDNE